MSHRRLLDWKQKTLNHNSTEITAAVKISSRFSEEVFDKSRNVLSSAMLKIPKFLFNPVDPSSKDYLGIINSKMTEDGNFYLKKAENSQSTENDWAKLMSAELKTDMEESEEVKK